MPIADESMFDQRRVSQERVIGISFVDILIQAVFVLLVALFVGYVDPEIQVTIGENSKYGEVGKDLCHKLNKDSIEACREYVQDKQLVVEDKSQDEFNSLGRDICLSFGASSPEECRKITDKELARLRPCLKPVNEFSVPATLTFSIKSPREIEFLGFSSAFFMKLEEADHKEKLLRASELERLKGTTFSPTEVQSSFDFIRESTCYHAVHARRPGPFSDTDLRVALAVLSVLRQPSQ